MIALVGLHLSPLVVVGPKVVVTVRIASGTRVPGGLGAADLRATFEAGPGSLAPALGERRDLDAPRLEIALWRGHQARRGEQLSDVGLAELLAAAVASLRELVDPHQLVPAVDDQHARMDVAAEDLRN